MDVDLGVFSYLDGERWHGTGTPGFFIVDGKTEALVKPDESFGVRRGYGNVVNTRGWHVVSSFCCLGTSSHVCHGLAKRDAWQCLRAERLGQVEERVDDEVVGWIGYRIRGTAWPPLCRTPDEGTTVAYGTRGHEVEIVAGHHQDLVRFKVQ